MIKAEGIKGTSRREVSARLRSSRKCPLAYDNHESLIVSINSQFK